MKEMTVSLGTNLVSTNEKLTSIPLIELYEKIAHANPTFTNEIEVLRSVYHLSLGNSSVLIKYLAFSKILHDEKSPALFRMCQV